MGSSRNDGDTASVVQQLAAQMNCEWLDLNSLNFSDYDYQSRNSGDDFLPAIRRIVENYDHIIWATPVYWYTMSAVMKRFIDRISDCLRIEKETGRKFRGMSMSLVSVSNDVRNEHFASPFVLTADYLGMTFTNDLHVVVGEAAEASTEEQIEKWLKARKSN